MSAKTGRRKTGALLGAGLLMVLCCAIGPALIGAAAGAAIGGWVGIAAACLIATAVAVGVHLQRRRRGGHC